MSIDTIRNQVIHMFGESHELHHKAIESCADSVAQAANVICSCLQDGGRVLLFGNGGSAADAQHIAAELVNRFVMDRTPLPALALTTDTSALTAIANDYGFEQLFARQIQAWGQRGDVAVAISTSGSSANVLTAVSAARERGLTTIGLTGGSGGRLASMVEIPIVVPSSTTARIQECHILIGHIFCEIVEIQLFKAPERTPFPRQASVPFAGTKQVDWQQLSQLRRQWQSESKLVVWTNGCFDLFHVGHLRSLQTAKSLGDVLVVGVNSDESVRKLKGPGRPIIPYSERVEILAGLGCTDCLVMLSELTPEDALSRLKPHIHCKGADYAPPEGKPIPEARVVESYGGRIEFLPLVPFASTSELIRRIRGERVDRHDGSSQATSHLS